MIRLVIADDHPIVRAGLTALFDQEADLTVVAEAATPEEAIAAAQRENPDVVLMDLQFGNSAETGADATRHIRVVLSLEPVASTEPSGLNVRDEIPSS